MRLTLITFLLATSILPAQAASPEEQAVLIPIQATFDAMAKRDPVAFQQALLPGGSMVLMRGGKPTQMTFAAAAERIAKPDKIRIEERIYDPVIHIDNDLAVVWAPFDFLVDGKIDHCGTDLFNLVRQDGKWMITAISDTGHGNCAAH
jgi:hypothetical protein